ncbi:uncharacterized protein LOC111070341 [Drosophila obscura]|uniref:uncharacterized protein LOC111070341 n=1 Tax=Drosophila obscura TaxID=7282 RepID=UPI001BB28DFC|nr:uncharacterized protein LOC111070341 [Drosophila obscura]
MASYFIIFLLCGLMCAVLTAPHPPEVLEPVNQELVETTAGSGDNSAEQYMNAMEERTKLWWKSIAGTDYSSEVYDEKTSLDDDYLLHGVKDVTQLLPIR